MGELARQYLDGHITLETRIVSMVNSSHATAANFSDNFVTADLFWDHCCQPVDRSQSPIEKNLTGLRKLHTSGTTSKPVRFVSKDIF
jgi:hypothetical protein